MPRFIIERAFPNAGKMSDDDLYAMAAKSYDVLHNMGPSIQWQESYITDDKIYCVYIAPSEDLVREHAKRGQFPIDTVATVRHIIDPTTAESSA
ncbi:MAG: DUF4242 domain-containing protein [Burkholderiales bacterium]|nr:DUF4242 domain-containing protein [Burkholderiales bacterium]